MIRTTMIAMACTMLMSGAAAAATNAGEHSGFGHDLFASRAPAGFSDPIAYTGNMDAAAAMANAIEPASGSKGETAKR